MPRSILPARWTDQQVPVGDQIFLDHTANFVGDLDQAATSLQRLGFAPSGINLQTNLDENGVARPSGTSNRLVRLRRGFLEFLAATHDTPLADQLRAAHARYEGLHLVAVSHADLDTQHSRLVASGFDMQPMVHMRRRALEPGLDGEVAWSILRTLPGIMAEGRIQFVYPHTPELTWPPGSTEHPNCADSLTGVTLCVAEPEEAKSRYGAYLDRTADSDGFTLDRGVLRIVGPDDATTLIPNFAPPSLPFIAAVTVASGDLDQTRRILGENGVPFDEAMDGFLWVGPDDALGCHLCFHGPQLATI
jgi:hypothetical protein